MKKFFLGVTSLLVVFSLLVFNPSQAWAADGISKLYCNTDGASPPDVRCVPGLICKTDYDPKLIAQLKGELGKKSPALRLDGLTGVGDGICTKPNGAKVTCRCLEPGKADAGHNGFTCDNGPTIYCASKAACQLAAPDSPSLNREQINLNPEAGKDYRQVYPENTQFTGVACTPQEKRATCTCTGGANFKCDFQGKTGTASCGNKTKCVAKAGAVYQGARTAEAGDLWGEDVVMGDIQCEEVLPKVKLPLPPPPSPPCTQWVGGLCTTFNSAAGNLKTEPSDFISSLFAVLLSLSGGVALLLIIKSGYQLMTSQGKPEAIQGGRDQLIAAIVGLVFLIFSFIVLQVIGYDILRIPGFGGGNGGGAAAPAPAPAAPAAPAANTGKFCTGDDECTSRDCGGPPAGPGGNGGHCQ